jgi:hypothetical protein
MGWDEAKTAVHERGAERERRTGLLAWAPLLTGAVNSYGPIHLNYGFALYFLTYQHGFVKRGLLGELLSGVHWLSRTQLMWMQYAFLAAAFALTYAVFRPVLFGNTAERRLAAALLSGPALLPHLGFLFAQPDVMLYILLLLSVWLLMRGPAAVAIAASCAMCCVALLEHEAYCLMFYPLIAALLLHLVARGRMHWAAAAAHVTVFTMAFVCVMHWGTLKVSPDTILAEAQARTNVGIQRQLYDVMGSSFAEQRALVGHMYSEGVVRILMLTVLLTAPYLWLLGRLVNGAMKRAGSGVPHRAATLLLFTSPLLLCALGHDTTRWIGAMCIDATLFVLYLYMTEDEGSAARGYLREWAMSPAYVPWVIYLIAIGPYGATGLRAADQLYSAWTGP